MFFVVLIVKSDVHNLFTESVFPGLLYGLLNLHAFDTVVRIVHDDGLQVVDTFGGEPWVAPLFEIEVLSHVLLLLIIVIN